MGNNELEVKEETATTTEPLHPLGDIVPEFICCPEADESRVEVLRYEYAAMIADQTRLAIIRKAYNRYYYDKDKLCAVLEAALEAAEGGKNA